jgi:hypothetical protein
MKAFFDKVIIEPLREVAQSIVAFLPSLLSGLVVLVIGFGLAWLIKLLAVRIVRLLKIEAAFARSGVTEALGKMAVKDTPAKLIGRTFFWLVMIIFLVLSLRVMKVPVIDQLLERFLLYLPNVFVAIVILVLGWFLANFAGRAALIASVNAGSKLSGALSRAVKGVILVFAFVMAFEQLGIGRHTIVTAFIIAFGGVVLALALAFGLGGRDAARRALERRLKDGGGTERDEIQHL